MDAYSSDRADLTYSDQSPVIVAASNSVAFDRARQAIEHSGFRVSVYFALEDAIERIRIQPSASAVWIELDEDAGTPMDELLELVTTGVLQERYGAVVSISKDIVDPVFARVAGCPAQIIVDAGLAERAAAFAMATTQHLVPLTAGDVASDQSAERLRQLSDEVGRIASTLARLSTGPSSMAPPAVRPSAVEAPPLSAETVRSIIRARRLRARFFHEELFADPAWDMLLDLLQAEIAQLRVPVSSLCIAAAVPATTALRWLKTMVSQGLFIRRADPHDGRRVFVELAPEASKALRSYFGELGPIAVI